MDFFSHALLPYLLGNFFKRKKEETTAFVLGGIAPDIDVFILWINFVYPTFFLLTHRGITHSLFFGFFTGVAVIYLACRAKIKTKIQRFTNLEPVLSARSVAFAYAGVLIHLFLDYVTTRGIPLFYPFSTNKYSAEVFFYTDIGLTIVSLMMIIFLFKRPVQKSTYAKFLLVFLVAFAVLGGFRVAEKNSAEEFFRGEGMKVYPTMNPFNWYALGDRGDEIMIYEYSGLNGTSPYNETVPRLNIISGGEGLGAALYSAGELPQVKMFRWRAYTVGVNASFSKGAWLLEYYDPLSSAMFRDVPSIFRWMNAPLRVKVEGGKAVVL